jgi:hypothetical protein
MPERRPYMLHQDGSCSRELALPALTTELNIEYFYPYRAVSKIGTSCDAILWFK